jgi:hypothetical protein
MAYAGRAVCGAGGVRARDDLGHQDVRRYLQGENNTTKTNSHHEKAYLSNAQKDPHQEGDREKHKQEENTFQYDPFPNRFATRENRARR